jgi:enediyne biosynthesis protein E4
MAMRVAFPGAVAMFAAAAVFAPSAAPPPAYFEDRSAHSGILFVLNNAVSAERHQIETMAGGVAVFDYDNDGYPDIYFANGAEQPSLQKTGPRYRNRLYRNKHDWTFEDVTDKAGVGGTGYNIGVATADYDNDGHADLFVTGVNGNTLFHNRGDGTFEDVTRRAGLESHEWAVAAAWVDYDNDGRLDLFVVNYVKWDPASELFCGDAERGIRTYCHPRYYQPLANRLYRNNGDGTFSDVSAISGIAAHAGKGMGIVIADYDHDGWMDVFVANDTVPNFLFHNERNGTFREVALQAGVGYNDDGKALSSMGADFRDLDNDGWEDLVVTALSNQTFPVFRNVGRGLFSDVTYQSHAGVISMPLSGWGMGIFDFDNDGWKDVFVAAGDVQDNTEMLSSGKSRQQNLLMMNDGDGGFRAAIFGPAAQHRGVAFGDFDRDGRVDAVVTRLYEPPVLLRNTMGDGNHWLTLRLAGTTSNRDGIGARVIVRSGGVTQVNHVTTSTGYACSSELAVHFGLGRITTVDSIEIDWPSGSRQTIKGVSADSILSVRERPAPLRRVAASDHTPPDGLLSSARICRPMDPRLTRHCTF